MKSPLSSEAGAALARNPIVRAGLAVVVLLGVTAGVLVLISSVRGGNAQTPKVIVEQPTQTVGPTSKTAEARGVHGLAIGLTAIRSSPGASKPVLGTVTKDTDLVIDGRTTDSHWYRAIFPPASELHGWVDASLLTVTGDPTTLVVATAEPPVVIEVPTEPPPPTPLPTQLTPAASPTSATPGAELPDLVVGTTPVVTGGKLFVSVVNQGKGVFKGALVVAVFNEDNTALIGGTTVQTTIEAGKRLDVGTGIAIAGDQTLLIVVDPNGTVDETDNTNNRVLIHVATGEPGTPTPVVPPTVPPPPP
jgi:hypothetical protein